MKTWLAGRPCTTSTSAVTSGTRDGPVLNTSPAMAKVELILDWVEATSHIRRLKDSYKAATSFGKLFARSGPQSHSEMMENLQVVSREMLRQSRTRLDSVAMLVHRRLMAATFSGQRSTGVRFFIFIDASPQWRGCELFATSLDTVDAQAGPCSTRLLPVVSLDACGTDGLGKVMALLWQVFLCVGPSWAAMKQFLHHVQGIVSDMGTERAAADFPDLLDLFFEIIDCPVDRRELEIWPVTKYLFPRALQVPGWKHLFDNLLQRGLTSLRCFPAWFEVFKALVSFLRRYGVREVLATKWRSLGLSGPTDMLMKLSLPSLAEWRWGSLAACTTAVRGLLDTISLHMNASWFKHSRDSTRLDKVFRALRQDLWKKQLVFVDWFACWLTDIMNWGTTCPCCPVGDTATTGVSHCKFKGRRFHEAYEHSMKELRQGLDDANLWTPYTFGCGQDFWTATQGCVRSTFGLAAEKLQYLDRIPWLLCRIDQAGVARRCIEQYDSVAPEYHHRVSTEFLGHGTSMRSEIEAIRADGTGLSQRLAEEVRLLKMIPMDDGTAERPHGVAAHITKHARACSWQWMASTMRLAQNLDDVRAITGTL